MIDAERQRLYILMHQSGASDQCYQIVRQWIEGREVNPRILEILKVFYSLFTTLMDTQADEKKLIVELRILNQRLKEATEASGPPERQ